MRISSLEQLLFKCALKIKSGLHAHETDRQTDRQTDTQTDRNRDKGKAERETDRERRGERGGGGGEERFDARKSL